MALLPSSGLIRTVKPPFHESVYCRDSFRCTNVRSASVRLIRGGFLRSPEGEEREWKKRPFAPASSAASVSALNASGKALAGTDGDAEAIANVLTQDDRVASGTVSVVLLAGGVGKRMGASIPKQYLLLNDIPIAVHSFLTLAAMDEVGEIVVVCEPEYQHFFKGRSDASLTFALPGKERQDSVFNGLQKVLESAELVAVHDSARPLLKKEDARKVMKDAKKYGAAALGVRSKATIKQAKRASDGEWGVKGHPPPVLVEKTLDRQLLWEMQTPQVVKVDLLRKGFDLVRREGLEVTDDVSVVEYLPHPVIITEGSYTNLKVTTPDDMIVAERIIAEQTQVQEQILTIK